MVDTDPSDLLFPILALWIVSAIATSYQGEGCSDTLNRLYLHPVALGIGICRNAPWGQIEGWSDKRKCK